MTLMHRMRIGLRRLGLDVRRFNPSESIDARFFALLKSHRIDLILDVGSNDGGYATTLRQGGFKKRIVSFEPLLSAHAAVTRRATADPLWTVAPRCALGASPSEATIHIAGNSTSSSLLTMLPSHLDAAPYSASVGRETVPVRTLDSFSQSLFPDASRPFPKIDTQGYELPVLEGAELTLSRCVGVQLEMSLIELYHGQALYRDLIEWLEKRGFALWALLPGFHDPRSGRMLQADGLFFRDV